MSSNRKFDVAIMGSGVAGINAAITASQNNLSVCLIDMENALGGISYNYGCVPTKTLLHTAFLLDHFKQAESFGIRGINQENIVPDWMLLSRKVKDNIKRSVKHLETTLNKNNITRIHGHAQVIGPNALGVNHEKIFFSSLIIATGSQYQALSFFKPNYQKLFTPKTIYSIREVPNSITIIGAGMIGIEFAFMFASFGSIVHLVDKSTKLMPYMDEELSTFLTNLLKEKNISLHLGFEAIDHQSDNLYIKNKNKNQSDVLKTDIYLSCIGRQANLSGIEYLIDHKLELTKRGFISTNLKLETTLPGIYAAGDINGRFMLAHVASKEGEVAANNIAGNESEIVYDLMPYNMYTSPEFASVGLTERKAREQGFLAHSKIYSLNSNIKVMTESQSGGFIKVVSNLDDSEILGVHIVGDNATDLIGEAILYMTMGATPEIFKNVVHPHPSMSEALVESLK